VSLVSRVRGADVSKPQDRVGRLNQGRGAGGSRMIWIDVKRNSYRPLRGLHSLSFFDPGADAPGFMLSSASRTETDERCVK